MKKTLIIARHEFVTTVKRVAFIILTFGLPLLMTGIMLVAMLSAEESMETTLTAPSRAKLWIVDNSGLFGGDFPDSKSEKWIRVTDKKEALRRVNEEENTTAIIIPKRETYLKDGSIRVETSIPPSIFAGARSLVPGDFRWWMSQQLIGDLTDEEMSRALDPVMSESVAYHVKTSTGTKEESKEEINSRMVSGLGFFFALFLAISVSGGYLVQGLVDEKENRVLEMVLSSVTPTQLMFGKLLGLGAAGLLQVLIWSSMGVFAAVYYVTAFVLNPVTFILCGVLFLLGYLLYGSLMLGLGSLGSNVRESTQYTAVVTILAISPMFFWMSIATDPQGTVARVMSFIPLTAPVTMMLRYTLDPVGTPFWELGLVFLILIVSTWLGVKLSARLYRVGLLLYGKRPTPREILRWLFAKES